MGEFTRYVCGSVLGNPSHLVPQVILSLSGPRGGTRAIEALAPSDAVRLGQALIREGTLLGPAEREAMREQD